MDVSRGCGDPVAGRPVLLAERSRTGTRTENRVDPAGGRRELGRQRGQITDGDIGATCESDRVLGGGDRPPHPVPAVLGCPPARRAKIGDHQRARDTRGARAVQWRRSEPPKPLAGGAVTAPHSTDDHRRDNAHRDDGEHAYDSLRRSALAPPQSSLLPCRRVANQCPHCTWALRPVREVLMASPGEVADAFLCTLDYLSVIGDSAITDRKTMRSIVDRQQGGATPGGQDRFDRRGGLGPGSEGRRPDAVAARTGERRSGCGSRRCMPTSTRRTLCTTPCSPTATGSCWHGWTRSICRPTLGPPSRSSSAPSPTSPSRTRRGTRCSSAG